MELLYERVPHSTSGSFNFSQRGLRGHVWAGAGLVRQPQWRRLPRGRSDEIELRSANQQTAARNQTAQIMEDSKAPKVFSWSLEVEREIFKNTSVELRYLGTRGLELPVQLQLNSISAFQNGALPLPTYIHAADIPSSIATTAPTLAQFNALIGWLALAGVVMPRRVLLWARSRRRRQSGRVLTMAARPK